MKPTNPIASQFPVDKRLATQIVVFYLILQGVLFYTVFVQNQLLLTAGVLAATLAAFMIFRYPEFGILVCITMVFSVVSSIFLGGLFKVIVLATLVSFLASRLYEGKSLISDPLNKLVFPFTLLAFISLLYVKDMQLALENLFEYLKALVLFVLVANLIKTKQLLRITFWMIVLSGTYISSINIYNLIKDPFSFALRLGWPFEDPNNLALLLVSIVPIAYALTRSEEALWLRLFAFFCGLTIAGAVIPTLSRGGILALAIVMVFILFKERKNKIILYSFVGIISVSILIFYSKFGLGVDLVSERFGGIDKSVLQRYKLLQGSIAMFLDNPVFGVGIGNFLVYSTSYTKLVSALYAHNMFIHVAAELGFFAVSLFFGIVVLAFKKLAKTERAALQHDDMALVFQSRGVQLSLVGLIICGLFLSQQFNKVLWIVLGLSISLTQIAKKEIGSSTEEVVHA